MFNLLPKNAKFYDEMEQLSSLVVSSAQNLEKIVNNFPHLDGTNRSHREEQARSPKGF